MTIRKPRYAALLAAAVLSLGLAGCSGGGSVEEPATEATEQTPVEEAKPEQTDAEACETLKEHLVPALQESQSAQTPAAGEVPDFMASFTPMVDALEAAKADINNGPMNSAIDTALAGMEPVQEALASADYSSVDPAAPDALQQYQEINRLALEAKGVTLADFQASMDELDALCPIPAQ